VRDSFSTLFVVRFSNSSVGGNGSSSWRIRLGIVKNRSLAFGVVKAKSVLIEINTGSSSNLAHLTPSLFVSRSTVLLLPDSPSATSRKTLRKLSAGNI
jgi:hypothetical protein